MKTYSKESETKIKLVSKDKCTGCGACVNVCFKSAIQMEKDDAGFEYPIIRNDLCVNCDRCSKVCPELNKVNLIAVMSCYAGYSKNCMFRERGTSGGIVAEFAYTIISKYNGAVYGAAFKKGVLQHIRICQIDQITEIQGSKYIQSSVVNIYKDIEKDLNDGTIGKILFIGTPCQIAGLYGYLSQKDKDKLITCSFVCGGVSSKKYIDETTKVKSYDSIVFRNKQNYIIKVLRNKEIIIEQDRMHSRFYWGFNAHYILRTSCHSCPYAQQNRIGDITVGDFWGLNKIDLFKDEWKYGISIILPTSNKGMKLLEESNIAYNSDGPGYRYACLHNMRLQSPPEKPENYKLFQFLRKTVGYYISINILEGPKYLKIALLEWITKILSQFE